MSPREVIKHKVTPAWVSAICAIVVAAFALWGHAASASSDQLQDHEQRIRQLEAITAEGLSSIDAHLAAIRHRLDRIERDDR